MYPPSYPINVPSIIPTNVPPIMLTNIPLHHTQQCTLHHTHQYTSPSYPSMYPSIIPTNIPLHNTQLCTHHHTYQCTPWSYPLMYLSITLTNAPLHHIHKCTLHHTHQCSPIIPTNVALYHTHQCTPHHTQQCTPPSYPPMYLSVILIIASTINFNLHKTPPSLPPSYPTPPQLLQPLYLSFTCIAATIATFTHSLGHPHYHTKSWLMPLNYLIQTFNSFAKNRCCEVICITLQILFSDVWLQETKKCQKLFSLNWISKWDIYSNENISLLLYPACSTKSILVQSIVLNHHSYKNMQTKCSSPILPIRLPQ